MKYLAYISISLLSVAAGSCYGKELCNEDKYYSSMKMYVLPESVAKGLLSWEVDEPRLKRAATFTITSNEIGYIDEISDAVISLQESNECILGELRWMIELSNEESGWKETYISDGMVIRNSAGVCRKTSAPLDFDIAKSISHNPDRIPVY